MSLEKVTKEIVANAQSSAQKIINDANSEASVIVQEARDKAKEQAKKTREHTKTLIEELKQTQMSAAVLAANKEFMQAKKSVLDEVFLEAKKQIENMDKSKRSEIIRELVKRAQKELPNAKFVYSNEQDKKTVSLIKGLTFKGTIDSLGGVIVENEDGLIRVNYTFEEILAKVWEENVNDVASKVFAKD